jgi:hypothetical protein
MGRPNLQPLNCTPLINFTKNGTNLARLVMSGWLKNCEGIKDKANNV